MSFTPTRKLDITRIFLYAINKCFATWTLFDGEVSEVLICFLLGSDPVQSDWAVRQVRQQRSESLAPNSDTQHWLGQFLGSLATITVVLYDSLTDVHRTIVTDIRSNNDFHGPQLLVWRKRMTPPNVCLQLTYVAAQNKLLKKHIIIWFTPTYVTIARTKPLWIQNVCQPLHMLRKILVSSLLWQK
jgi:hypothetical protein